MPRTQHGVRGQEGSPLFTLLALVSSVVSIALMAGMVAYFMWHEHQAGKKEK